MALVAVGLLGVASGGLGVNYFAGRKAPAKTEDDVRGRLDALSLANERAAARIALLEARDERALEVLAASAQAAPPAAPSPGTQSPGAPPARETPEDQRREQEGLIAQHAAELVDATWARATAHEVDRALDAIARPGDMKVTDVQCRSHTCVARLTWPSQGAAFDARHAVLELPTDLPCERRLYLGEEGARHGGFEGTLLFTCER